MVQTNAPYRPAWVGSLRGIRAVVRLVPYMASVFAAASRVDVVHIMANSGWAWHLFAAPAIWISRLRARPVVVNYRGGLANAFLQRCARIVQHTLRHTDALVVPSRFLQEVFASHGMAATIVPNVIDTDVFRPVRIRAPSLASAPHIVVTRNLERLYGNDIAIRALAIVRQTFPGARLSIAGSGPELESLQHLAKGLGLGACVAFTGRLDTPEIVSLYNQADVALNPSRADNMPNSILEALACGVPVVSTDVGGVPYLVEHGRTAWLVPMDAPECMAAGILKVLQDEKLRGTLVEPGTVAEPLPGAGQGDRALTCTHDCAVPSCSPFTSVSRGITALR
jgi:glycosyltransferase involved in cell wall biosynthesis